MKVLKCLLVLLCLCVPAYVHAEEKADYYDMYENTVYLMDERSITEKYIGTGVVVAKKGSLTIILTNKHVCGETTKTCNLIDAGVPVKLSYINQDKKYDLALWFTTEPVFKKEVVGFSKAFIQEDVYNVGNYLGFPYIYSEGTFAGYYKDGIALLNLPCTHGCSGSGVFDSDSKLVGIIFAGLLINDTQEDTAKTLMIESDKIVAFLNKTLDLFKDM